MRRPSLRGRLPTLTSRLVLTAVALVAVITVLVGGATAIAMRSYLTGQLDDDVRATADRAAHGPGGGGGGGDLPPGGFHDGSGSSGDNPAGQAAGSVTAIFHRYADYLPNGGAGAVITDSGGFTPLDDPAVAVLHDVPLDGEVHRVDLPGLGDYRVEAVASAQGDGTKIVSGLPDDEVGSAVHRLLLWEGLLILAGVLVATAAGLTLVRRQLRPLREVAATAHDVAALPLESGEIGVTSRVPAHLTDERSEVGQVGAALNTLLEHVETSLDARHRSEQRVRQFVADASHELRTPLTTIAGYTELARRRPDDAEASATALAKVEEESARMTSLVEDLLLLARLDSGRPLDRQPVDLTRLLLEAVSDARVVAPDHRWRLDLPDEAVEVVGDEQRLHQVVTNLLTNARKYTPAGTTVTVTARADGFAVHDDGPGFPADLRAHAFERFARGDVARHRQGGVGLGLALVEAIVQAHGGSVSLASEPGDTTVDVRLGPGA